MPSIIGYLYKFLVSLLILAVCFLFVYETFGWIGPIVIILGAFSLFYYLRIYKPSSSIPTPSDNKHTQNISPLSLLKSVHSSGNWQKKVLFIFSFIVIIIIGMTIIYGIFLSNEEGNSVTTVIPIITSPTQTPTQTPTTLHTISGQSCDINGKWIQTTAENTPVTGVYIQIYSDKRIEIYLNNQLRSWGNWEAVTPDQLRFIWTGGTDANPNAHTITVSPDCQSFNVLSFRGEHSTFRRIYN